MPMTGDFQIYILGKKVFIIVDPVGGFKYPREPQHTPGA